MNKETVPGILAAGLCLAVVVVGILDKDFRKELPPLAGAALTGYWAYKQSDK